MFGGRQIPPQPTYCLPQAHFLAAVHPRVAMASLLLLEDDSRALEDALAFLDEWHAGVGESRASLSLIPPSSGFKASSPARGGNSSDGSLCDTDGSTSPPATPVLTPAPAKVVRKTTVDKRKDEIRLLRRQAEDLHARAELLRQMRRHAARGPTKLLSASGLAKNAMLVAMWKGVADRQQRLRGMSEAENARLRSEVADQDMMLKAIRSMLKRRKRKPAVAFTSSLLPDAPHVDCDDLRRLEKLCDQMEVEAFQARDQPVNFPAELPDQPPVPKITKVSPTKIQITYRESRAVPFAFVDVAAVLWDSIQESCLRLGKAIVTVRSFLLLVLTRTSSLIDTLLIAGCRCRRSLMAPSFAAARKRSSSTTTASY